MKYYSLLSIMLLFIFSCTQEQWNEVKTHREYKFALSENQLLKKMPLETEQLLSVFIENQEDYSQDFYLSAEKSEGFNLEFAEKISVNAREKKEAIFCVKALKKGSYKAAIFVVGGESFRPNKKEILLTVDISTPAKVEIIGDSSLYLPVNKQLTGNFIVRNTGKFSDKYALSAVCENVSLTLTKTEVKISSGEYETVDYSVMLPESRIGKVDITAVSENDSNENCSFTITFNPSNADFTISGNNALFVAVNESTQQTLNITNNGDVDDTYKVETESSVGLEISAETNLFAVKSGESKSLALEAKLNETSSKEAVITLTSVNNPAQKQSFTITFNPSNVDFTISGNNVLFVAVNESTRQTLNITNNGDVDDTYKVETEPSVGLEILAETNLFAVKSGESKSLALEAKLNETSSKEAVITLTSVNNPAQKQSFIITFNPSNADFSISGNNALFVAVNESTRQTLNITNNGDVDDTYKVETESSAGLEISAETNLFAVKSGESKSLALEAKLNETSSKEAVITLTSVNNPAQKQSFTITFNPSNADFTISGNNALFVAVNESTRQTLNITNNGDVDDTYKVETESSAGLEILAETNLFAVKSGESKSLALEAKLNETSSKEAVITLTSVNNPAQKQSFIITFNPSNVDFTISGNNALFVAVNESTRQTLNITNNGDVDDTYKVETEPSVGLEISAETNLFAVKSGESKSLVLEAKLNETSSKEAVITLTSVNNPAQKQSFTITFNPSNADFTISGNSSLSLPLNAEILTSIVIHNNTDIKDSYFISADSDFAQVKLSKNTAALNGKSHETIEVAVKLTEKKSTEVKIICSSANNPKVKREHVIKLNVVDADFSIQSNVGYYTKGVKSQIKVTVTNNAKQTDVICLRFENIPSFVQMDLKSTSVELAAGANMTLSFPYLVNADRDEEVTFDLIGVSTNVSSVRRAEGITLWELTSRLVSLAADEDTRKQIDLLDDTKKLQKTFRDNDYIKANETAMQIVAKLADFAGVEQKEPENDMYFIDADEPEVRIEVPQTPAIFSNNVGEFRIAATENAVRNACYQSGEPHSNNLFRIGDTEYYLQKNGQPYIPTKKFVKGVPLLDKNGNELCTSYFRYVKTVSIHMKSHTSSSNGSGYEHDTFREDLRKATEGYWALYVSSQKDSQGVTTSYTYKLYKDYSVVKFEVTEEADDSREFLSELDDVPTSRIVIFTHGTLFYKWVTEAKQHGNYYMFCENGEGNTAKFFKQPSVAKALNLDYSQNDKAYYFNWSGENNYEYRDAAAEALEKFIYDRVAANLFYCRASQIILIGHSHGVTVNNITMHNLQTDKMEKFASEIPFVVGLNGVGTSTADIGDNEKSNRDCFKFPNKTFNSLSGDKKVKMYNFYSNDDEIVPPAFDDGIIPPYNYSWEIALQIALAVTFLDFTYLTVQLIRLAACKISQEIHILYRDEAHFVDFSNNISIDGFISGAGRSYYDKNIEKYWYQIEKAIPLENSFTFGWDGFYDHQTTRIYCVFNDAMNEIDSNLMNDKLINLFD